MKTIVMTGGSSGIGRFAAERMANAHHRVLLGGRRPGPAGTDLLPLDLTSLDSVRTFGATVADRLPPSGINALVLNAGLSLTHDRSRTADGFETTFAVNHLAQYLLLRLLMPHLATGAVVVLTTSSTHDPAAGTLLTPPRHADADRLAYPDRDPERVPTPRIAGGHAYSASKLCNVLTARALAAHQPAGDQRLTAIAYDPGATPGTGLMRRQHPVIRFAWRRLAPVLRLLVRRLNSAQSAGNTLARLALAEIHPPAGHVYGSLRRDQMVWHAPSELALEDETMWTLWHDSAALTGIPENRPAT